METILRKSSAASFIQRAEFAQRSSELERHIQRKMKLSWNRKQRLSERFDNLHQHKRHESYYAECFKRVRSFGVAREAHMNKLKSIPEDQIAVRLEVSSLPERAVGRNGST